MANQKRRTFNGKIFTRHAASQRKTVARHEAQKVAKKGWYYRVTKDGNFFVVWKRNPLL